MKMMTSITPTMLATAPAWIESAPSSAPTVRSSKIWIGAGAAAATPLLDRRQDLVARRQTAASRVLDRHALVDQLKAQLGGAAQQRLHMLGIVDPRQLHEDAVLPLALDRRLLGAGLVDAATDDLDRLLDRLATAALGRGGAELHRAGAVSADFDGEVGVDLGKRFFRVLDTVGLADREGDRVTFDIEAGITDMCIAQGAADTVDNRAEAIALSCCDIDFEQQVGAAAQIEAERDLPVRDEARQPGELGRREQVRQAEQH